MTQIGGKMNEQNIDLWDVAKDAPICITTNGYIKYGGDLVMGRGCALQAKKRYPRLPFSLGERVKLHGNVPHVVHMDDGVTIISFPVKHNWWEKADKKLIRASLLTLNKMIGTEGFKRVYLPRPGCGNGGLDWETEVKPLLETNFISERIVVVHK